MGCHSEVCDRKTIDNRSYNTNVPRVREEWMANDVVNLQSVHGCRRTLIEDMIAYVLWVVCSNELLRGLFDWIGLQQFAMETPE